MVKSKESRLQPNSAVKQWLPLSAGFNQDIPEILMNWNSYVNTPTILPVDVQV